MEMCVTFLHEILSKYFDLSSNIEKYFWLGLWILFYGFFILIMRDYGEFLKIFRVAFFKKG